LKHKAIFSVGDYKLASFADYIDGGFGNKFYSSKVVTKEPRPVYGPPSPKPSSTGVRKGHIRNVGGKAVAVGQSILKAGKNTAGKLAAGGKTLAGQGLGAATSYAGRGVELIAKNPKTSALIAGGTAVAGGGGYLLTRKKRNRR
jgi:LPXTG-motif cell wall-anchored protein